MSAYAASGRVAGAVLTMAGLGLGLFLLGGQRSTCAKTDAAGGKGGVR